MEHATHTHASQLAKATSAENHRTHTNGNFMCPCVVCFVPITCSFAPGNTSLLRAVWALQCVIASMASLKQAFVLPPLKCPNWKRVLRSGSRHGVQGNCVFFGQSCPFCPRQGADAPLPRSDPKGVARCGQPGRSAGPAIACGKTALVSHIIQDHVASA